MTAKPNCAYAQRRYALRSMSRIFVSTVLWLVIVFSGQAKSAVIRITPIHLQAGGFVFAVTNTPVSNGLSFFITIKATGGEPPDGYCRMCLATSTTNSHSIGPAIPGNKVSAKKGRGILKAKFVASHQLLSNPDASFVFTVEDRTGPDADFYVIKLWDFIRQ